MDPDLLLRQIRRKVHNYRVGMGMPNLEGLISDIEALDEWLSKGGFPPEAWRHTR